MTKDELDLSGAYALDAVSAEERAAYERVLATSDTARAEATELQDTAILLGLAAEPVQPPASMKAALLAQIAATPQFQPGTAAPEAVAPATATPAVTAEPTATERKAQARWFQRPAIAIASVAAAVAIVAGAVSFGDNIFSTPEPPVTASALEQLTLADDKAELVSDVSGGGTVTMLYSADLGVSAVSLEGESALDADLVYQLWYIGEDGPRSAGFLPTDADDDAWQLLDGSMKAGDAVGITVEPKGGSEQPTTAPVAVLATA